MNIKVWIEAARLRTLPLSVSGIIVGSFAAYNQVENKSHFWIIFGLAFLTTLCFQVLSNFANDYGDGVKGTDNENRVGPQRAIQSGAITQKQMKTGIIITSIVSLLVAILLIYVAFGSENFWYSLLFTALGIGAIAAAIKYTVGKSAYGYRGLGDIFVFVFFGLVSVIGSSFLYTMQFDYTTIFPAITIGLLSVGVLNLNNMRDIENDIVSGKNTIVVKMGSQKAKTYHIAMVLFAFICLLVFDYLRGLLIFPTAIVYFLLFAAHLKRVNEVKQPKAYDSELKVVAIGTFLLSLVTAIELFFTK
ncbi:1,4-dihydroxy-2-naphthoate octaprenyltransferase [Flavobacterium agricola]|uniref:1,4-dihydroxy-2-naphthoate octaprenyltransferase n=1 Tax=Flavobacterium agricola TaxID=2870839 RepID=A0ABY6LZF6_9FLAO|nr:1,4-dihydroxy-2-naphthoate octaprenyltransferase [Flavobacterium agricola]UYW01619.1 1,4-dihydroxy-2-naphthoate octaprenyltransferase [Flavobacterium agricola]